MLTLCTMALARGGANLSPRVHRASTALDACRSRPLVPARFEFNPLYPTTQYLYVLASVPLLLFVRTLVYSPFGQSLRGIRENMLRMHAVGAPVRGRLVLCYTLSAAIAGIAGGSGRRPNAYVTWARSASIGRPPWLIILVLGGHGRLYGAFSVPWPTWCWSHFSGEDLSDRLAARARPFCWS